MKGHIRRRGENSFELKYEAGIDPRTGKRITKYASFKGSKREAQAKLNELFVAVAKGSHVDTEQDHGGGICPQPHRSLGGRR